MASEPQCADTVGVEEEFLLVDTASGRTSVRADAVLARVQDTDPYGEDLTIALHTLYELHYGGFDGVNAACGSGIRSS